MITDKGVIIRFNAGSVSQTGRATLGVRLMKMEGNTKVVTMAIVDKEDEEVEETETVEAAETTEITEEAQNDTEEYKKFEDWEQFQSFFVP